METTITTPTRGTVSIQEGGVTPVRFRRVQLLRPAGGHRRSPATPERPWQIGFDSERRPSARQSAATIEVFKDGALVPECPGATTAPPGGGSVRVREATVPLDGNVHPTCSPLRPATGTSAVPPFPLNANPCAFKPPDHPVQGGELKLSKAASSACSTNYGACLRHALDHHGVVSRAGGTPNALVTLALCNAQVASSPNPDGHRRPWGTSPTAKNFGNARGSVPVPNSGTSHLNAIRATAAWRAPANLTPPSSPKLTQSVGPSGTNTPTQCARPQPHRSPRVHLPSGAAGTGRGQPVVSAGYAVPAGLRASPTG